MTNEQKSGHTRGQELAREVLKEGMERADKEGVCMECFALEAIEFLAMNFLVNSVINGRGLDSAIKNVGAAVSDAITDTTETVLPAIENYAEGMKRDGSGIRHVDVVTPDDGSAPFIKRKKEGLH